MQAGFHACHGGQVGAGHVATGAAAHQPAPDEAQQQQRRGHGAQHDEAQPGPHQLGERQACCCRMAHCRQVGPLSQCNPPPEEQSLFNTGILKELYTLSGFPGIISAKFSKESSWYSLRSMKSRIELLQALDTFTNLQSITWLWLRLHQCDVNFLSDKVSVQDSHAEGGFQKHAQVAGLQH